MTLLSRLLLAGGILVSTAAGAGNSDVLSWYLGVGIGQSRLDPDTGKTGYSVSDRYDTGFKVFAGYDWSDLVSTEIYYTDSGEARTIPSGAVEYRDLGISAVLFVPKQPSVGQNWNAYGKLGVGQMKNDSNLPYTRVHDYHAMLGAGIELPLANRFALRLELDLYDKDASLLSVNLLQRTAERR